MTLFADLSTTRRDVPGGLHYLNSCGNNRSGHSESICHRGLPTWFGIRTWQFVGVLSFVLQTPSENALLAAPRKFVIALDHIVQLEGIDPINAALN